VSYTIIENVIVPGATLELQTFMIYIPTLFVVASALVMAKHIVLESLTVATTLSPDSVPVLLQLKIQLEPEDNEEALVCVHSLNCSFVTPINSLAPTELAAISLDPTALDPISAAFTSLFLISSDLMVSFTMSADVMVAAAYALSSGDATKAPAMKAAQRFHRVWFLSLTLIIERSYKMMYGMSCLVF